MFIDQKIISEFEKIIKTKFKNLELLENALIHRSILNENKKLNLKSNERLEFLGDAVLELWTSDTLFNMFPDYEEGKMTNLRSLTVCTQNLATTAKTIDLGDYVCLSRGEKNHGGQTNESILADTFESIIGAIYVDSGYKSAAKFLQNFLLPSLIDISTKDNLKDPKSLFQEISQAQRGVTPHYVTVTESGPDHQKTFEIAVYLDTDLIATGQGASKQKAEEIAATKATKILKNEV